MRTDGNFKTEDGYINLTVRQILETVPAHCNRCGTIPSSSQLTYDPVLLRVHGKFSCHGETIEKNICSVSLRHDPEKHLSVFSAPKDGLL